MEPDRSPPAPRAVTLVAPGGKRGKVWLVRAAPPSIASWRLDGRRAAVVISRAVPPLGMAQRWFSVIAKVAQS